MADLGLQTFDKLYPMLVKKYKNLSIDQNADIPDKINQIVNQLNALGKLSNDVVRDWNTVYNWVMNDGLTTDVNNKIEAMNASGELNSILTSLFNSEIGDLTTLQTVDKTNVVAAINDNVVSLAQNTSQLKNNALNVFSVTGVVGDGSHDDTAGIQSAIQTAHNTGINAVFIPSGTYMINVSTPLVVPSNMTIFGVKGETVLKVISTTVAKSSHQVDMGVNCVFTTGDLTTRLCYTQSSMGTNIHFDGLTLDGNWSAIDQTGFDQTANSKGFDIMYVDNVSIRNCKTRYFLGSGIYTYGCSRQVITDNISHDNGHLVVSASRNGISLAGGYTTGQANGLSYDAIVSRNLVHNNVDEGIQFGFQTRCLISDNIVHDNGDRGIEGDTSFTTTDTGTNIPGDIAVINNFVYSNKTSGITVGSSNLQRMSICNNVIKDCGGFGISVNQNNGGEAKISDNIIVNVGTYNDGNIYHGIQTNVDECTVQNNTVYQVGIGNPNTGSGVAVSRGYNIVVTGNKVSYSQVHGITVSLWNQSVIGVHAQSIIVASNVINKCKIHGINFGGNSPTNASYNRIRQIGVNNNNIFDAGEGATAQQAYGIMFRSDINADSVVINGNTIYEDRATKNMANSIWFQTTTNGTIVNAIICGNEISQAGAWAPIGGYTYITKCIIEGNSNISSFKNSGTFNMPTGSTSYVVNHGLNATPTKVLATAQGNLGNVWIDTITTSQMTVHCATAPGASAVPVSWRAEV